MTDKPAGTCGAGGCRATATVRLVWGIKAPEVLNRCEKCARVVERLAQEYQQHVRRELES